jgi:hypothetical protein
MEQLLRENYVVVLHQTKSCQIFLSKSFEHQLESLSLQDIKVVYINYNTIISSCNHDLDREMFLINCHIENIFNLKLSSLLAQAILGQRYVMNKTYHTLENI